MLRAYSARFSAFRIHAFLERVKRGASKVTPFRAQAVHEAAIKPKLIMLTQT